ncbi:MAG: hypothetical protein B6242_14800 [Anaerolineaceae bacterium 4572_78]|nr:MAG: hypothetical protein B6242_14800 [Anaerolineaceae bacterium 4572_78]
MTTQEIKKTARLVGGLTLLMAVIAIISMIFLPTNLIVPGDATTTATNIMASEGAFRTSIAGNAVILLIEIVLTVMLYVLLKPVNKTLSMIAAFSRLAMTTIQGINLLNQFFVLLLLSGAGYLTVFEPAQLHALVQLFLNAHEYAILIWGLFFALHLLGIGYLVYKSGYIPKTLGILLIVSSLCYLIQSFGNIIFPQYKEIFTTIGFISIIELAFPLWLVIKGVKVEKWEERVLESA